jgi:adenylyltransferase/sulfurtransferase
VLAPAAAVVASLQVVEAMKVLLGDATAATQLATIDLWPLRVHMVSTADSRRANCPACGRRQFEFLDARPGGAATSLCGRNTVQVRPARKGDIQVDAVAARLERISPVERKPFYLRCTLAEPSGLTLTVFADGRALVHGTADTALARSIYARYVGN